MSPDDVIALITRKPAAAPLHLNVRLSKDDAVIYQQLSERTPGLTDSQRVKDSLRVATYLVVTKDPLIKKLGVLTQQ